MSRRMRKEIKSLIAALLLLVCVASSTMVVLERMQPYMISDEGAISLIGEVSAAEGQDTEVSEEPEVEEPDVESEDAESQDVQDEEADEPSQETVPGFQPEPGVEVSDDNVVWEQQTEVEIFRISYEGGEQKVTVQSDDGDKLIAPGTENSYTFKLKNTGNVPIEYSVDVDAYITPGDVVLPIETRLNRYDGAWIVGDADSYVDVAGLDGAYDESELGVDRLAYYTLEWVWPFENGNDAYDTLLGNMAVDEDITLTIVIKTVATGNDEAEGGILTPQTGDNSMTVLWVVLIAISLLGIIFLLIFRKKDEEEEEKDFQVEED